LQCPTLSLKVAGARAASGLAANRLELEITEAVLIRDDEMALAILHQLRELGIRIALDDFGTGYSSLSYLKRFPFDKIKIDRCFVSDVAEIDGSSAIVQAVVNIAAARNITTTAEGVETPEQKEMLRRLGCTEMQGYLFSAAKPSAEVKRLFGTDRESVWAVA
jgi:EAL domain-containing protein (putative c-di-GMP-specific phosphodiesterase class I)